MVLLASYFIVYWVRLGMFAMQLQEFISCHLIIVTNLYISSLNVLGILGIQNF